MGRLLRIAWDRFQIIGQANGDYIARFITWVMYFTLVVPFALIARFLVDPLGLRKKYAESYWRPKKPVGTSLDEARSQF